MGPHLSECFSENLLASMFPSTGLGERWEQRDVLLGPKGGDCLVSHHGTGTSAKQPSSWVYALVRRQMKRRHLLDAAAGQKDK